MTHDSIHWIYLLNLSKKFFLFQRILFGLKCSFLVLLKGNYLCELLCPYRRIWTFLCFSKSFFQKFRHFLSLRRVILRKEINVHWNHLLSQRERRCE